MSSSHHVALGFNIGHDRSAALVIDGKVVAAIAEERLDRRKYSIGDSIPLRSIDYVLKLAGIEANEISDIAFAHGGCVNTQEIEENWRKEILMELNLTECPVTMLGHHFAHACAAFYTSPFQCAAIAVADGAGDIPNDARCEAESFYTADDDGIVQIAKRFQNNTIKYGTALSVERFDYMPQSIRDCQISIGRKYQQITQMLGFRFGQAGKTMGLAPYGSAFLPFHPPVAGFEMDLRYGDYLDKLDEEQKRSGLAYSAFLRRNRARIAFDIQDFISATLLSFLRHLRKVSNQSSVCMAGGVFLNCVANGKIVRESGFDHVYIAPAAGDDGQAIGAALHTYHAKARRTRVPVQFSPFLGRNYEDEDAVYLANQFRHSFRRFATEEEMACALASLLAEGKTAGICRGRTEIGPRALGHRSILASPLVPSMKDDINNNIKYREDFRPFAPMVKAETAHAFFDLSVPSPYMLLTAPVRPEHQMNLVGITHVDGSARIQTLTKADDAFLYALLEQFEALTGYPILINTSFNTADEPMVETPRDAFMTFRQTSLDLLVFDRIIVHKESTVPETTSA
jgi:carbamoyltransferase